MSYMAQVRKMLFITLKARTQESSITTTNKKKENK